MSEHKLIFILTYLLDYKQVAGFIIHHLSFTIIYMRFILLFFLAFTQTIIFSQDNATLLLGRWEVIRYAEQGFQVDKKQDAQRQAVDVYRHVQQERAQQWYGYDLERADDYSKKRAKEFERWEQRDSTKEVRRIAEAIATPYFAVFFADNTLALYNKDTTTGRVSFQEARQYLFFANSKSIDIYPSGFVPPAQPGAWSDKMNIQILSLTADRMVLFLPQDAEIVELVKTGFNLP